MIKPISLATLLLASLMALQGCGGDSSDNTTTTPTTETATDDSAAADTGDDTTDESETGDDTDDDTTGEDGTEDDTADDSSDSSTVTASSCDEDSTSQIDALICATEMFIDTLSESEQASVLYDWDNSNTERTIWSNLPTGNVQRNGMRIGELSDAAYSALIDVAQILLNDEGYEDFQGVLAADDYLQEQGGGSTYSSANYYIAIFGTPSRDESWMIQLGGHHLAYNVTFVDGVGYPVPNHLATEPKAAFELNSTTYAPIVEEGDAMVAMFDALSSAELSEAYLSGESYSDVLVGPDNGSGTYPTDYPTGDDRGGILVSSLTEAQQALVIAAMAQWVDDYQAEISDPLMADYTTDEALADTYIAWAGSQSAGVDVDTNGTYLRIDGPRVWIELACQGGVVIRGETHYHTIYRDKEMDYGNTL